jgi:predicted alpha/beta hydrolase family esterase
MKRAIIVHGWDGHPGYCWYPDVKERLEHKGFEVTVPAMPDSEAPALTKWLPVLQHVVGEPDRELFLIGHSLGVVTILRYLETLADRQKVGGVVSVAGFTDDLGFTELKNFFAKPLDFEHIKTRALGFAALASDNDQYVDLRYGDILHDRLGARLEVMHNMNHFSGEADDNQACTSLPEAARAVLELAGE